MENDQSELPLDRISILPDNVKDIILCCLSTRDAVRKSILSKNWRHVWTKLTIFELDETLWENISKQHSAEIMLTKILYQLLLCHDGPINDFLLSIPDLNSCPEIDNLIAFLAKKDLEYFALEMWKDCYLLPHSFFSCQKLTQLKLRSCSIRSSPEYAGFSMLTTLELIEVTISAETLAIPDRRLPTPLIYLKDLSLYEISFNDSGELSFVLCLLKSSPNLKFIYIEFEDECDSNSEETTKLMEGDDYSDICLNQLLKVKLEGVTGTKPELEFTKILLAKSSSLKKIKIQPKEGLIDNGLKIVKEVLKFRRISKEAEVIFDK